jgi:ribosomal protein L37E
MNMALIKCPECGKDVSDKAKACPHCGCPISEPQKENDTEIYTQCPECGAWIKDSDNICSNCGFEFEEPYVEEKTYSDEFSSYGECKKQFNGVYRISLFGKKTEVYCPRCGSENCSIYHEQRVIPGKSKTSYTMNLNPFKPFTIMNKKEKVLRRDRVVTESKFVCNDCGRIFT